MSQLLSSAASGLVPAALKLWTAVTTAWQAMMAEQPRAYQHGSITCAVPVRNGARSTPASMIRLRGSAYCER